MARIDKLLQGAKSMGASDLHIVSGALPYIRVNGDLRTVKMDKPLSAELVRSLVFEILSVFLIGKILGIIFSVIALIFLLVSILCYKVLLDSTVSYGKSVRSIFDLHRKELLEKFDLKSIGINSTSDEKEIWKRIKEYLYYPTD